MKCTTMSQSMLCFTKSISRPASQNKHSPRPPAFPPEHGKQHHSNSIFAILIERIRHTHMFYNILHRCHRHSSTDVARRPGGTEMRLCSIGTPPAPRTATGKRAYGMRRLRKAQEDPLIHLVSSKVTGADVANTNNNHSNGSPPATVPTAALGLRAFGCEYPSRVRCDDQLVQLAENSAKSDSK